MNPCNPWRRQFARKSQRHSGGDPPAPASTSQHQGVHPTPWRRQLAGRQFSGGHPPPPGRTSDRLEQPLAQQYHTQLTQLATFLHFLRSRRSRTHGVEASTRTQVGLHQLSLMSWEKYPWENRSVRFHWGKHLDSTRTPSSHTPASSWEKSGNIA